jgi:hypothetical protein
VAEGTFCLPLFLRIKDGKQLQLQLSAEAISTSRQCALAVRGSHSCQLAAPPIGELQPPLQQYTLRNAGAAPLRYRYARAQTAGHAVRFLMAAKRTDSERHSAGLCD